MATTSSLRKSYIKPERIYLKNHPELNEKWVQDLIWDDTSMLGLGKLIPIQKERSQPRAGRLDLLLQGDDDKRRYEVEIQLGATDETHLIRTIEYWDVERKRYPQYDHCAVIIAEDITSRFLNVISLFNGSLPLIALQMQALRVGDHTTLVFTTVMDELKRGYVGVDEEAEAAPTDRSYWEKQASKPTVALADKVLETLHQFDPTLKLKYNKFYIGLEKDGQAYNFVTFRPKKSFIKFEIRIPESADVDELITNSGLDALDYDQRWKNYRLRLTAADLKTHAEIIRTLAKMAYDRRASS